uniref:Uncharacterized protein n=1 Tax=Oryza meridionalis TaxID=40149 RepID=A0A0E0F213_9ORYZ
MAVESAWTHVDPACQGVHVTFLSPLLSLLSPISLALLTCAEHVVGGTAGGDAEGGLRGGEGGLDVVDAAGVEEREEERREVGVGADGGRGVGERVEGASSGPGKREMAWAR